MAIFSNLATVVSNYQTYGIDLTGSNPENHVIDELHYVNVVAGKNVIVPISGTLYGHDVVVKITTDGINFTTIPESQYAIKGPVLDKTEIAFHKSGVFSYIVINLPSYVGTVAISYHAFGGNISYREFQALKSKLDEAVDNLASGNIIGGPFARQGFSFYMSGYVVPNIKIGEVLLSHDTQLTKFAVAVGELAKNISGVNQTMTFLVRKRSGGTTTTLGTFVLPANVFGVTLDFDPVPAVVAGDVLEVICSNCGVSPTEGGSDVSVTIWNTVTIEE